MPCWIKLEFHGRVKLHASIRAKVFRQKDTGMDILSGGGVILNRANDSEIKVLRIGVNK